MTETGNRSISHLSPQPLPGEIWAVNASADFDDDRIALWVKVLPPADRAYLPIDLQLIISDENNLALQEIIARSTDCGLQIKFSGEVGERFNLQLKLGDAHSIDRFVI